MKMKVELNQENEEEMKTKVEINQENEEHRKLRESLVKKRMRKC
jgi:hypothetical protein